MALNHLVPSNVAARAERGGRVPFAFGRRFFLLLLIGVGWIVPAWSEPRFLYALIFWDALAFVLWAWDVSSMTKPDQLEIRRIWSEPLGLARKTYAALEVSNSSGRSVLAVMNDEPPKSFRRDLPVLHLDIPPRSPVTVRYPIEPRSRGDAVFGDVWIRCQSPMRLAERWARAPLRQTVRIYPNLEQGQKMRLYLIRSRQIEIEKRLKRRQGQGREFESLREYRPGDEFRDISWSATARCGKLITKVYQIERSQTVWLVLDAGRLLRARVGPLTKLDYAVNAALSLAQVAFDSGDRVALLAYGRRPQQRLAPGKGVAHLRRLLESLSQVHAEGLEADHRRAAEQLLSLQGRRGLIVWLTDLAETAATPEVVECAEKMARRHLVLLAVMGQPDLQNLISASPADETEMYRYTAALEIIQRRDLLLRQLRRQGVLILEVAPTGLPAALVNRYLEVKQQSLL